MLHSFDFQYLSLNQSSRFLINFECFEFCRPKKLRLFPSIFPRKLRPTPLTLHTHNLQVVSIDLRTNLLEGVGVYSQEGYISRQNDAANVSGGIKSEIDFCKIINANLPEEIQVVGWAACQDTSYSAR